MSTLLTINVTNNSPATESFYFFQQPAIFTGGAQVYSDSLYCQALGAYDQTGAVLTVQANSQPFACLQEAHAPPQVGAPSGYSSAIRSIALADASGTTNDATNASMDPLGLSQPAPASGVQPGAFRITTPPYAPIEIYNLGSAVQVNGGMVLSSFVPAMPNFIVDCQPIPRFYVQTGNYTAGTVINFSQASVNAAICDFSGGYSMINVTLNADGTWSVQVIQ